MSNRKKKDRDRAASRRKAKATPQRPRAKAAAKNAKPEASIPPQKSPAHRPRGEHDLLTDAPPGTMDDLFGEDLSDTHPHAHEDFIHADGEDSDADDIDGDAAEIHIKNYDLRFRILRLITWLPKGGIERKIVAVLPRLDPERFDVQLICLRERGPLADDLEEAGIPVRVIPFRRRWDPLALWRLRTVVRTEDIDLIHAHMYRANTPATLMKFLRGETIVLGQYHNVATWEKPSQLRMDRWLAKHRDLNITVSDAVRRDVSTRLCLPEEKTFTLYNGVDTDEFRPISDDERRDTRDALGLPHDAPLVVMVARLVTQKNHAALLRAIPELLAARPDAHFVLLGGGQLGQSIDTEIRRLDLLHHVHQLGPVDDVARIVAACDIFVLPSLKEGFSNALLEAMACGVPPIVSRVGGNDEVVDHGMNGYVIEVTPGAHPGEALAINEAQFQRHLRRLLVDDDLRRRFARQARTDVMHFSLDRMVQNVEGLYTRMLEGDPV